MLFLAKKMVFAIFSNVEVVGDVVVSPGDAEDAVNNANAYIV